MGQLYFEKAYVPEEWIDKEESSGKYWASIAVQTAAFVLVAFLAFANGAFS